MTTKTYDFADPSEFTFDSDLIDFTISQKPRLKLQDNPGQDFIEDCADDTDFIYDSDLAEFVAGKLQQKNKRPTNAILYASFDTDEDATWTDIGTGVGTLSDGATVHDGALDLTGYIANRRLSIEAYNTSHDSQQGCMRCLFTPNYSGAPSQLQYIMQWRNGGLENNIQVLQNTSRFMQAWIRDATGGNILATASFGVFDFVADQTYEIEFNWDCDAGEHRLFIDGIQFGSTQGGTGTRDGRVDQFDFGVYYNNAGQPNFSINAFLYFNAVQHTTDYTPDWSVIYDYDYVASVAVLPEMQYTGAGTLITFDSFATVESGTPRYSLQIGRSGNYLYWDGAAWSVSDGTYAQANDATTFNTNLGSLDVNGEIYGQFKIHFTNAMTPQSWIDTLTASLTAQIYPITNPSISFNNGISIDSFSSFSETATKTGSDEIKYILSKDSVQYYWDGAAWSVSDGTYAQSNTAAEIETNKASFTASGIDLDIEMFLHSNDGTTTPLMTALDIIYDLYGGAATTLSKCTVWGYIIDGSGNPVTAGSVRARLTGNSFYSESLLKRTYVTGTIRSDGYWELDLINTATLSPTASWKIEFLETAGNAFYTAEVSVPDQDSAELKDLI